MLLTYNSFVSFIPHLMCSDPDTNLIFRLHLILLILAWYFISINCDIMGWSHVSCHQFGFSTIGKNGTEHPVQNKSVDVSFSNYIFRIKFYPSNYPLISAASSNFWGSRNQHMRFPRSDMMTHRLIFAHFQEKPKRWKGLGGNYFPLF